MASTPHLAPIAATQVPAGSSASPPIPRYLEQVYWWAYVHPNAVRIFERPWLVNTILFSNYRRLCNAALGALGTPTITGDTLQVACVYGDLTPRLIGRLAPDARLNVIDVLPVQLDNLRAKIPVDPRISMSRCDSSALQFADARFDQVLMFFLLHEQPEPVRRATLAESIRVLKPGGKLIIVDYHRPVAWHPLRPLLRLVFGRLEPYAIDLWQRPVEHWLPEGFQAQQIARRTWMGGVYQLLEITR